MWSLLLALLSVAAAQVCQLVVPFQPLSYTGLVTPYQLQGCDMRTAPSFVEAVIFDLDALSFSVYHPLVINAGTTPLFPPVQFTLPKNAVVGVWFGSNAQTITLTPALNIQDCVYNIGGPASKDAFGQFAHCGAVAFFSAVEKFLPNLTIPALGKASDGENCLTTRDFGLVDMDPADNVVTTYLVDMATGRTAQNTLVNQAASPTAVVLKNGSDNLLLSNLDLIMGCTPFKVVNLADPTLRINALALDEIHATVRQQSPYAYLSKGDPMVRINNLPSLAKLNAYRQGVFQPVVDDLTKAGTLEFCAHYTNIHLPRLQKNRNLFLVEPSPDPAVATNLFGFLSNRFLGSFLGLNCGVLLDIATPVTLVLDGVLAKDAVLSIVAPIATPPNDPYLVPPSSSTPAPTPEPTTLPPTLAPTPEPTTLPPTPAPTPEPTTLPPTLSPTPAPTPMPTTLPPSPIPTTLPTTPIPTHSTSTPIPTTTAPQQQSSSWVVIMVSSAVAVLAVLGFCAYANNWCAPARPPAYIPLEPTLPPGRGVDRVTEKKDTMRVVKPKVSSPRRPFQEV